MSTIVAPAAATAAARPARRFTIPRKWRNPIGAIGAVVILLTVLIAVAAPLVAPYSPSEQKAQRLLAPSGAHLMGTDELGRDTLSRIIYGARVSLQVGIIAVLIAVVIGTVLGVVTGYFGGRVDTIIMRFVDIMFAFPGLILAIVIAGLLGPSRRNAMIAIGIVQIPVYARLMRAQVLTLKDLDFVAAARALGASPARLIGRHLLPNLLNPLIVQISLSAAAAMLAEATLSFLRLGAQPPTADWGFMMNTGARFLNNDPWLALGPGLAISIAVFGFNWLGDALRDALDPRTRS